MKEEEEKISEERMKEIEKKSIYVKKIMEELDKIEKGKGLGLSVYPGGSISVKKCSKKLSEENDAVVVTDTKKRKKSDPILLFNCDKIEYLPDWEIGRAIGEAGFSPTY